MIEEIDQAIENLLHVAEEEDIVIEEPNHTTEESDQVIEEPNQTIENSDQSVEDIPSEPEQEAEKFEPISTPISDADLLRVAYTLWRVHDAADGGKTQKDFITKFLKTFGAEYNFHDKLSKSFDVKNETILDKMVEVFEKEKEKRAQKS